MRHFGIKILLLLPLAVRTLILSAKLMPKSLVLDVLLLAFIILPTPVMDACKATQFGVPG